MRNFLLSLWILATFGVLCPSSFGGSETRASTGTGSAGRVPTFTLNQAILTALQQNPTLLNAEQEIKRTKGVIIQVRAQALPQITANAQFEWIDPNLSGARIFGTSTSTGTGTTPGTTTGGAAAAAFIESPASQVRDVQPPLAAASPTPSITNVQQSQLKDQQNRFEAGTVPRFNVLQAEVALYNQIPQLITAQNNYRISKLTLAKTLGLDFEPRRGENPPLEVVGEMPYTPRSIALADAIELGKQRRPFLKQARANVLNQLQQVRATAGQLLPTINTTGGGEWVSSPTNSSWHDISKGWIAQVQGSVPIWDSGAIYGQVKQQRALLSEAKITYDDDVRQVELEIQTAYSNLLQNRELIKSQEKNVEQAEEALRLAKARLDAGAGVQLDVLNAQVQLLTAQTTRLQALFGYNSSLAEFDRATGAQSTYNEMFADLAPRATKTKTYYTGSGVDAEGKSKQADETVVRSSIRRSRTSDSK